MSERQERRLSEMPVYIIRIERACTYRLLLYKVDFTNATNADIIVLYCAIQDNHLKDFKDYLPSVYATIFEKTCSGTAASRTNETA